MRITTISKLSACVMALVIGIAAVPAAYAAPMPTVSAEASTISPVAAPAETASQLAPWHQSWFGGVTGTVHMGPTCPAEVSSSIRACWMPVASHIEVWSPNGRFHYFWNDFNSDSSGMFYKLLFPGRYLLKATGPICMDNHAMCMARWGNQPSQLVTLTPHHDTQVNFFIDTGIR